MILCVNITLTNCIYCIEVIDNQYNSLEKTKMYLISSLLKTEENNIRKSVISKMVHKAISKEEIIKIIKNTDLSKLNKSVLLEIINN